MTPGNVFVAGDWGTSHLQLFLCRGGEVLERRAGPGIAAASSAPELVLFELLAPWVAAHGCMPVRLAGMVGSRNGWKEAPYVACPADAATLADAMLRFEARGHDVAIVPGVVCSNPCGASDVMRGEETQILGALRHDASLAAGQRLLVLPGTHVKWVLLDAGRIVTFQTSLAGELYALLRDYSTLARVANAQSAEVTARMASDESTHDAFQHGLARSRELAEASLLHLLFETRSRQLAGEMSLAQALAFLSGLIIGRDVLGALKLFPDAVPTGWRVPVIGAPKLTALYGLAFGAHGIEVQPCDGAELVLAGLNVLAGLTTPPARRHASAIVRALRACTKTRP